MVLKSATNYLLKRIKKITLSIKKDNIARKRLALKIEYKKNNKSFLEYDNYEITN